MPAVVIAAAITAGASTTVGLYGAHAQGEAEDKALAAQQAAEKAKLAEQQREFDAKQAADKALSDAAAARHAARIERLSPWVNAGGMALADLRTKMGLPDTPPAAPNEPGSAPSPPAAPGVGQLLGQAMSFAQLGGQAAQPPTTGAPPTGAAPPSGQPPSSTPQPGYVPVQDTTGQIRYVPPTDASYWFSQLGTSGGR